MKKVKNYFYRIDPNEVLSELTLIEPSKWLTFFLDFFHDLKTDNPEETKTRIAATTIAEAHYFRRLRSKAVKASAEQRSTDVQHMLKDVEQKEGFVQPIAVAVAVAVAETITDKPKPKVKRFVPPSVEEVTAYCQERKNGIDPQNFIDHYQARGWIPKGYTQQMKDWKATVRTWEKNNGKQRTPSGQQATVRKTGIIEANGVGTDFLS